MFVYSYLGLNVPTIGLQCFGAAAAISAPSVPDWNAGYNDGNVSGLLNAMLAPVGRFGKVLVVFLSLSVTATNAPAMYSIAVPRYVFSVFASAVITALSIVGQHKFNATLSNFLVHGYLRSVLNTLFPQRQFALYDIRYWNVPSQLPLGAAALGASVLSFALVIPSMSQVWYTGPIARKTGILAS
ncbi:hypothetical protein BJV77DRAFT_1043080, partial [Russula vinacea]